MIAAVLILQRYQDPIFWLLYSVLVVLALSDWRRITIVNPSTETGEDRMKQTLRRFVVEAAGQDLIEYALLAGMIALAAVAAITAVGQSLNVLYNNVNGQVQAANGGA